MTEVARCTLAIGVAMALAGGGAASAAPPTPVAHVDLQRYAGLWYEIGKIPNRFQDQCASGTTAEYTLRSDGTLAVVNRCVDKNGRIDEARGVARVEDRASNARLKVSFVRLLFLRLFWGDYWIIGLGPDYDFAVVGHPTREYGWILARTPRLAPPARAAVDSILRAQGYDPGRFEMTEPATSP
jgi:apolipoprotein D and lipocalin family protein